MHALLHAEEMFPAGDDRFLVRWLRLASGLTVRAVECGAPARRTIVLLPGWACPAYTFRLLLPLLCEAGYRAMVVEPKGHGLSDKPLDPGEYSTASMVSHVVEILDAIGEERVVLGGLSLGAALAARAAAIAGERITALVLLSPVGTHGYPGLRFLRVLSPPALLPLYARLVRRPVVRFVLWLSSGRFWRPTERDLEEYRAPMQFREYPAAMRGLLHRLDWGETTPFSFSSLRIPVLLVYGTADRLVLRPRVLQDARSGQNVHVAAVEGAGHVITEEAPEAVAREMLRFLRSVPA